MPISISPARTRRFRPAALTITLGSILFAAAAIAVPRSVGAAEPERHVAVVFSGGHETDPRDHGRPVALVAGALGVSPEVFRQAFSGVHPAPPGVQPTPDEQRANKAVLLGALAPYGITNERLDEVSDHYRYQRSSGQLWPCAPASAYAVVRHRHIASYVITSGGSGYTSLPTATVPGFPSAQPSVVLSFGPDYTRNGSVAFLTLSPRHGAHAERHPGGVLDEAPSPSPGVAPPPPPAPPAS